MVHHVDGGSQRDKDEFSVRHGSSSVQMFSRLLYVRTSLGFLFTRKHQQRVTYSLFVRLTGSEGAGGVFSLSATLLLILFLPFFSVSFCKLSTFF